MLSNTAARIRGRTRRTLLAAAVPAALAAVALPAAAEAATLRIAGGGFSGVAVYTASLGEVNNLLVHQTAAGAVFDEFNQVPISIEPGSECRIDALGNGVCPGATEILVFTGDRNDMIRYTAPHGGGMFGGDGADTIFGGLRQAGFGRKIEPVGYDGKDRNTRHPQRQRRPGTGAALRRRRAGGRARHPHHHPDHHRPRRHDLRRRSRITDQPRLQGTIPLHRRAPHRHCRPQRQAHHDHESQLRVAMARQ